ncbi:hypothetical protein BHUM_02078 [Candidatus Burkholderia humilis]|nr:hypothetical protein BHUM_02078 [Candidatus Burkholderia humilis]
MDAKPTKIPTPDKVQCPDSEPTAVEFLATELPEHVRAFFDEQRKSQRPNKADALNHYAAVVKTTPGARKARESQDSLMAHARIRRARTHFAYA